MLLPDDFREFIELVNSESVPYLVIGGWAFNWYAEPRYTGDIDFFVDDSDETESKLRAVLTRFGFGGALPPVDESLFQKSVIMLGRPPLRIDLLTRIDGVTFQETWANRVEENLDGVQVNFISIRDLIKNKLAAGRPKDLVDVDSLRSKDEG